jgi:hypothetical protein
VVIARVLLIGALALIVAIGVLAALQPQPAAPPTPTPAARTESPRPSGTVALSSPTPTPSASPTPSAAPLSSQSPGSTPPAACPTLNGGTDTAQAQITAIRAAHQPGVDRIVFEFGPSTVGAYGMPIWSLSVRSSFTGTSGKPVPVDGNAFYGVLFRNASTVDPSTGKQTFTQTDIRPGLPLVREIKLIDDFERVMSWGLGLERLSCASVTELANPARLVVDLPTPP